MSHEHDHRIEHALGKLLTAGTTLAGIVLLGGIARLILHAPTAARPEYGHFSPAAERGKGIADILKSVLVLDAHALLLAGVLVLILTPVARVVFTLAAFALRRDWLYVGMTTLVLGVLAYGLLGGKVH
jgi:uncharacterized membrane protein